MAGDVPGPVSWARAWALCTEDRMSEGMSPSWPQPAKIAPAIRAGAGGGWTNGEPEMVRADQSEREEELTAVSGAGPVLSSLVSVLWSLCPLLCSAPEHLSSLLCSGIRSGALLPCSQLTAQLTAQQLTPLLAPSPGYTLHYTLCLST